MSEEFENSHDTIDTEQVAQRLGQRLREARENKNLLIPDIAEQLYLPKRVVIALEAGNFTEHPGLTFMRGYLQTYARLLELPTLSIMSDFDNLGLVQNRSAQTVIAPSFIPKQPTISERSMSWFTGFIFVGLFALLLIWWQSHRVGNDGSASPNNLPVATNNTQSTPAVENNSANATKTPLSATTPTMSANNNTSVTSPITAVSSASTTSTLNVVNAINPKPTVATTNPPTIANNTKPLPQTALLNTAQTKSSLKSVETPVKKPSEDASDDVHIF
ncbi:MAG: helix-turn-helix domain-containing protein [Legionellales bacterium]|nr:helix-turn-helix domain-containing protein [Legionellales bacterium]